MNAVKNSSTKVMKNKYGKENYKIVFTDHILDNLYGQIPITEVEKQIEKLAIFKRLHNISQLGFTNLIFPCALHTRYVHSLGVMHTAYNMALHINMNQAGFFSDIELQVIRLAGMLHDIGHYPLSHNIEAAYKNSEKQKKNATDKINENLERLVGCPDFLHPDNTIRNSAINNSHTVDKLIDEFSGNSHTEMHHESIGREIIKHNKAIHDVVRDVLVGRIIEGKFVVYPEFREIANTRKIPDPEKITADLLDTIASIIVGNYEPALLLPKYEYQRKYSAMVQLLHSEMDADNLDYLLRDATFSGTSYGIMDVNVLLNSLVVSKVTYSAKDIKLYEDTVPDDETNSVFYIVGIKEKGIGCIDQYFQNKYLAYTQMIYSKYVSILEAMLLCWATQYFPLDSTYGISTKSDENDQAGLKSLVQSKETKIEFLQFTDDYVKNALFTNFKSLSENSEKKFTKPSELVMSILTNLTSYRAFNLENENSDVSCAGLSQKQILNEMRVQPLYKEFETIYATVAGYNIDEFYGNNIGLKLFPYRFETYLLTKQLPWKEFKTSNITEPLSVFKLHFYRLANGIPIIKQDSYEYEMNEKIVNRSKLPELIVDSSRSVLHSIYRQQFVSLRKYVIEPYADAIK